MIIDGEGDSELPERKLLDDIERPHIATQSLLFDGDSLLIDQKVIIRYARVRDNGRLRRGFEVSTDASTDVVRFKGGDEFVRSPLMRGHLRGKIGTINIRIQSTTPGFYVGTDYKIEYEEGPDREGHTREAHLVVHSKEPARLGVIDKAHDKAQLLGLQRMRG